MITSCAVSTPRLPHHRRVMPQTRRTGRLCRSPGGTRLANLVNTIDGSLMMTPYVTSSGGDWTVNVNVPRREGLLIAPRSSK
jgi:hypothetical protein